MTELPPKVPDQKKSKEPSDLRKDNLFNSFWADIKTGHFIRIDPVEIDGFIARYMGVIPLTDVLPEERVQIQKFLWQNLVFQIGHINNETIKKLVENEMYFVRKRDYGITASSETNTHILVLEDEKGQTSFRSLATKFKTAGYKPLTPEEKRKLFSDPSSWDNLTHVFVSDSHGPSPDFSFTGGSRSLIDRREYGDGYYDKESDFTDVLKRIRAKNGKAKIKMLDVGGNVGRALHNAKLLDSNIETFNMTLQETPAIWGDHIVRHPAEMMPKSLEEDMDVIESNVAFRYFTYPDIALVNVIKALSVGGEASIHFQTDMVPLSEDELTNRLREVFRQIKNLIDNGDLTIDPVWEGFPQSDLKLKLDLFDIKSGQGHYINCKLRITKNKTTRGKI